MNYLIVYFIINSTFSVQLFAQETNYLHKKYNQKNDPWQHSIWTVVIDLH